MAALQVRLGAQRPRPARRLDEGRHAQDLQDLSRCEDRQVRLPRHQGPEDRLGNGADGRAVRRGRHAPGRRRPRSAGADGTIWHPDGRWAATVVRLCGGICILDAEKNFDPVAFLQFNKDSPRPVSGREDRQGHWEVMFDKILSPGHEIGFSPDGRFLVHDEQSARKQLLGLRLRAIPTRATGRRSPMSRIRCGAASIRTRSTWCSRWTAPSSICRSCIPRPATSGIMVVDTKTWTIKKEIQGIGPDLQTPAITYDGKYVLAPFSGFQRSVERHRRHRHRDRRAGRHPAEQRRPP